MRIKFDSNQQFQIDAIDSIVDIFEGQPRDAGNLLSSIELGEEAGQQGLLNEVGAISNSLLLDEQVILENVKKIQDKNGIELTEELQGMHFSTEMETGTGKTYVYLRTIFELAKNYNFKKFIILVPSVAIKEGVASSIRMMSDHFQELYSLPFDSEVYDGKSPETVHQFATSTNIQIMIMTIDAIKGDKNNRIMWQSRDKLNGIAPGDYLRATNPMIIMDEPQNMTSDLSKVSVDKLNPLCTLRYSATHKEYFNLMFRLDPVQAHEMGLVKSIVVAEAAEHGGDANPYMKLVEVRNEPSWSAKVELACTTASGVHRKTLTVKKNDNFARLTKNNAYEDNYVVTNFSVEPGFESIELLNGTTLQVGHELGGNLDSIYKEMIRETIREHLKKEYILHDSGVKVLSLFFIDKVANYIDYDDDGNEMQGKFAKWFEELLEEEMNRSDMYRDLWNYQPSELHDGYFSIVGKRAADTSGVTQNDVSTYDKIMKKKEQLLSAEEPLRFVFSHSALREGWDNPNVFQICTLREMGTETERRQTIGRGLRLPVNQDGERVMGEGMNRQLTVIANESYRKFADNLQNEYKKAGVDFGYVRKQAFSRIPQIEDENRVLGSSTSEKIWDELKDLRMIDAEGRVLDSFQPSQIGFKLELSDGFTAYESDVITIVRNCRVESMVKPKRSRKAVKFNKEVYFTEEFRKLWDRISTKTTYNIALDRDELVNGAVEQLKRMDYIEPLRVDITRNSVRLLRGGVSGSELGVRTQQIKDAFTFPDIINELQDATSLTRHTLVEILQKSNRLKEFIHNPTDFIFQVKNQLLAVLAQTVVEGIKYEKIDGSIFEMTLLEDDGESEKSRFLDKLYEVKNKSKTIYDYIEFDSEMERKFAELLDSREDIRLFMKLPSEFKISTPVGPYNPDWAIVKVEDGEEQVYMIRETKGSLDDSQLRQTEKAKIDCAKKHFETVGTVSYDVSSEENWRI